MKQLSVKKGQILQRTGDVSKHAYIVEKGLLRSYIIDAKGKEHIFMFAPEDWIIADARELGDPSDLFIDALEDSQLRVIEKDISREEVNARALIKRMYVLQRRVLMLMSATAIERYEHFVKTYPDIIQRVPQKMIASYLGITPEALSKVKNERFKNH